MTGGNAEGEGQERERGRGGGDICHLGEERRGTGLPSRVAKREGLLKFPGGVDSLLPLKVSHPKRVFEKRGRKKVLLLVNLMME